MLKGYKLYSILKMKCPKCQEGEFFEGHPYKLSTMGKVNKRCSHCNQKFEIETGFYQGSYYVSYGLGVALFVTVMGLNYFLRDKMTPTPLLLSFLFSLIVFIPLIYALSKIIWANMFIKYDREAVINSQINLQDDSRTKV